MSAPLPPPAVPAAPTAGSGAGRARPRTYLVKTLPELRPPCPIQEDQGDVDQVQEYDQEGQR